MNFNIKIDINKMQKNNGYLKGTLDSVDNSLKTLPFEYKKRLSQRFNAIDIKKISEKINGSEFFVSKKMDGHFQLVFYNGEDAFMIGRNGTVRKDLPCLDSFAKQLSKNKIDSFICAAELYCQKGSQRSRVYDVIAALSDEKTLNTLPIAIFDIISYNNENMQHKPYSEIYEILKKIFKSSKEKAHLVETKILKSKNEIIDICIKWVEDEGAEGLIVRTDMSFLFKVKPKHTFDVVIVGYTEGVNEHKGKIKALLFAFKRQEDVYQIVGKVGTNFSEEDRESFFNTLSKMHINSSYIETDNDGVAFHMIKPEIIIEVGSNDIMIENTYGNPFLNPLVKFSNQGYSHYNNVTGVRFLFPVFERIRDDKTNCIEDIRFEQISDLIYVPKQELKPLKLTKSKILKREIYEKKAKGKIMVQKFLVWKTNKEKVDPRYPAYVFHYTNFSSGRKDPLQTEIRISGSESQIFQIFDDNIKKNVKKGWNLHK